jgi:cytochrome c
MRRWVSGAGVGGALFVIAAAPSLGGAARGTPAEATAMLAKAAAHWKEVGAKSAYADFTGRKPPFFDRDLYVVCIGANHTVVANGGFPALVGQSSDLLVDADGKRLGDAISAAVKAKGTAQVSYRWRNPMTGKVEPKIGFFQKLGDDVCGVGAYGG